MDKGEIYQAEESLENRISQMKAQFQQSYDVFIKAHEELSKVSFDSPNFTSAGASLGSLAQFESDDINVIVEAGSVDECISTLRSKIKRSSDDHQNTFPDVTKLLSIMNGLQSDIKSLTENQKQFSKLSEDVNNKMSLLEKRTEDSVTQLNELVVESLDGSDSNQHDDECSDVGEEEESFGSESPSD